MTCALRHIAAGAVVVAVLGLLATAPAELADVHLTDGTVLRGAVPQTADEVILRNAAGEIRIPSDRVARIEWLEAPPPETQPAEPPTPRPEPGPPQTQPAPGGEAPPAASQPQAAPDALTPPPMLSEQDILRLQLSELDLEGEPERVRVRSRDVPGQPELEQLVLADIAEMDEPEPQWEEVLTRGRPHEKLQVILKATGLKYVDRIDLRSEPDKFTTFRRRVLPEVLTSCARSGCHGGDEARVFRFPNGPRSGFDFGYTSFVLLDRIVTREDPLLSRDFPEESVLLGYMLPVEESDKPHPEVERTRLHPAFNNRRAREYFEIVEWIASLRHPHPDYQLEYRPPAWLAPLTQPEPPP